MAEQKEEPVPPSFYQTFSNEERFIAVGAEKELAEKTWRREAEKDMPELAAAAATAATAAAADNDNDNDNADNTDNADDDEIIQRMNAWFHMQRMNAWVQEEDNVRAEDNVREGDNVQEEDNGEDNGEYWLAQLALGSFN